MPIRPSHLTFAALVSSACALLLTGCGIGTTTAGGGAIGATRGFSGQAYGGANPIIGATVKVYSTGTTPGDGSSVNTGYGVGTMLQEAGTGSDTDSNGNFSFAGGYNCPAGQFAYITVTGGNTGANAANPSNVLVTALGRCEDLYTNQGGGIYSGFTGSTVYVNELSTIAAAYALGHFSTVTGTGAATVVSIGAPATNNAAQIGGVSTGCVAGVGSCTTTQAAGLAHAFQNAIDLVNPFANPRFNNGANATLPGNTSAVVPQALINTLGNILVGCVNSAGDVTSVCPTIFTATTIGSNVPNNTFSAMVNLAANPSLNGNGTAVANFFNLQTPINTVYNPALTSSSGLNDFTIAIDYPQGLGSSTTGTVSAALVNFGSYSVAPTGVTFTSSNGAGSGATGNITVSGTTTFTVTAITMTNVGSGYTAPPTVTITGGTATTPAIAVGFVNTVNCGIATCQGIQYTQSGALDINDVYYLGNQDASSGAKNNLMSFASNGTYLGSSLDASGQTVKDSYGVTLDSQGGVYLNNGGGSTNTDILRYTTTTGTPSSTAKIIPRPTASANAYFNAVDRANNLWTAASIASPAINLWMSPYSNSSAASPASSTGIVAVAGTFPGSKLLGLAVDPAQNVWMTLGTTVTVLQNTGTVAAPTYSASSIFSATLDGGASPGGGITFSGTPTSFTAYVALYTGGTLGVDVIVPTLTGAAVTAFTSHAVANSAAAISGTFYNQADGAGTIWLADTNSHAVVPFTPGATPTAYRLKPCLTSSSACGTVFGNSGKPTTVSIDSTGSIWVATGASDNVVQIIGSAAPTWPLLSLGLTTQP